MKKRILVSAAALAVGAGAWIMARDLARGAIAEAQDAPRERARFQATAVQREKGECFVFVVNQENGDLWRYDSTAAGYVKVAGPIK